MKTSTIMATLAAFFLCAIACTQEKSSKDRKDATAMYERICTLTKEYTEKLEEAPDSADWAAIGAEFEEKLDKINLNVPPDTDLLLTEGQNDTIHALMQEYVRAREERIHGILHPHVESDTASVADSLAVEETSATPKAESVDASHSHGN